MSNKASPALSEEITIDAVKGLFNVLPGKPLEQRETHISKVYLAGPWVYKIKKPVDFGFLNYTTAELRHYFCHQEVKLNKRLSNHVYEGVEYLCKDPSTGVLFLGTCENPLESLVKMRRMPDETSLTYLLSNKKVTNHHLTTLAKKLCWFYSTSASLKPPFSLYGDVEYIRFNSYENFIQLRPFASKIGGEEMLANLKKLTSRFTILYKKLFDDRIAKGRIKDGHGDLRADHIYFFKGLQIIDCIEFNDRFRFGDLTSDLAFLFMDLERRGHEKEAYILTEAYVRESEDLQLWALLDFYAAYRAIVRAKVSCLETLSYPHDPDKQNRCFHEARRFMTLGRVHTLSFGLPTLLIFMGMPASGKSALAQLISRIFFVPHLSSDDLRREIFPESHTSPWGQGFYTAEARERVYRKLFESALSYLKKGQSLIIDATFATRKWRQELLDALRETKECHVIFIEMTCSPEVLKERLLAREKNDDTPSDARIEHMEKFLHHYETPDEIPFHRKVQVDTSKQSEVESAAFMLPRLVKNRFLMSKSAIDEEVPP